MSSGIAVSPHPNHSTMAPPPTRRVDDLNDFYDKVFRLRDDVYAGKHPRIRLPDRVLAEVAPRPAQNNTPTFPSRPSTNGTPTGGSSSHPLPPRPDSSLPYPSSSNGNFTSQHPTPQRTFPTRPASSAIDPVLLTKSDNLIRAELQLKRQQLERVLKDQVDKKNQNRDNKDLALEESRIDVEAIFNKALTRVKPISGLQTAPSLPIASNNSEEVESFDENSYYSSQANSWVSEEVDSNNAANGVDAAESDALQAKRSAIEAQLTTAAPAHHTDVQPPQVDAVMADVDEEPYEPADEIEIYESPKTQEVREESDYSPPPADVPVMENNYGRGRRRGREVLGISGSSRQQSPVGPFPHPRNNKRKRTLEERKDERRAARQEKKRLKRLEIDGRNSRFDMDARNPRLEMEARNPQLEMDTRTPRGVPALSPEPYIKEEPLSPPPFQSFSDPQPSKRRALQPWSGDVEIVSAREARPQPAYYREQGAVVRGYRPNEEPLSPTVRVVPQRRPERDDQDLRRVASIQYARRPFSPEPMAFSPVEPRQLRAVSHAFVDHPAQLPYHEPLRRLSVAPRIIRDRSRSPEYLPRAQSPVLMAPPARRIVVDQYGNKYYRTEDVRESVAPPSRRVEPEQYYERAFTREPTMRAPARVEVYEEDNVRRMLPPPPRRFIEPSSDVEIVETRPSRQREYSLRPVDVDYAPAREVTERRPMIQYEEMAPPREYISSRAISVRPEVVRREAAGEYVPLRHESVQPGFVRVPAPRYREISIIPHDAYDDRRYAMAAPAPVRRYADEQVVERPAEGGREVFTGERNGRRVSYGY
ncbi:hypothetical protein GQ43DRAFT_436745 [Delitschia confertaspora ATCC 74209]|uniref:Uncharacterized protein n=1 Tax=Delitschia confertaspora ATCC 74209 TaxID=1513339 RepID=A0A9P4JUU9_9PLEO|nr:hypothetical protein GQ43DRAFT_436745 [Delitschia confertaspora ATCC 74209]